MFTTAYNILGVQQPTVVLKDEGYRYSASRYYFVQQYQVRRDFDSSSSSSSSSSNRFVERITPRL